MTEQHEITKKLKRLRDFTLLVRNCYELGPHSLRHEGVLMTDCVDEIIREYEKLKRATEALTAEIAYIAAESFEQTPTAHFPSDHDGIGMALMAYADILEEE